MNELSLLICRIFELTGPVGDSLLPTVGGVVLFLLGFFLDKFKKYWNYRAARRLFDFKKRQIEVVLPIRVGKVTRLKRKTSPITEYVTRSEAQILLELQIALGLLGRPPHQITAIKDSEPTSPNNDLFYIGGAFANESVSEIIRKHFQKFKIECSQKSFDEYQNLRHLLVPNENNDCMRSLLYDGRKVVKFDNRRSSYVVLAKLSGQLHFGDQERGTTHVLFGSDAIATLAAVKCLTRHTKELSARIRGSDEKYLVGFLCNKTGEVDFNTFVKFY